jgi:hypothetical protein
METRPQKETQEIHLILDPGVCGFKCTIWAKRIERRKVHIEVTGSECESVKQLTALLEDLLLRDLFAPMSRNPVFLLAEKAGCHPSCPVPVGVLKAAEVAMEMALARPVSIRFEPKGHEE